jgi:hypothetical protein
LLAGSSNHHCCCAVLGNIFAVCGIDPDYARGFR